MLRGEYARLLLEGKKVTTIRLGKVIPKYDEVIVHSWGRPVAKVRIKDVRYKKVIDLTDEDARKDGFENVHELINELKRVYGDVRPDDLVSIIEFEVIQRFDELKSEDLYLGLKPADIARLALRYLRDKFNERELKVLEELNKGKSIRDVARELTGSPTCRRYVRNVIRRALKELIASNLIKVP